MFGDTLCGGKGNRVSCLACSAEGGRRTTMSFARPAARGLAGVLFFDVVVSWWLAARARGDTAEVDVLAERLRAKLLSGPSAPSPAEAVVHLLAVQAQDLVAARLGHVQHLEALGYRGTLEPAA